MLIFLPIDQVIKLSKSTFVAFVLLFWVNYLLRAIVLLSIDRVVKLFKLVLVTFVWLFGVSYSLQVIMLLISSKDDPIFKCKLFEHRIMLLKIKKSFFH